MSTPERPSLADTIAHIDAAIAEQPRCTLTAQRRDVGSTGPFTAERCTRDALPGTDRCALHTPVIEPGVYDGLTWPPAVREEARRSAARLAAIVERRNAAAEPAPPDPDWVTFEPLSKPGWLARALRRLFT